MQLNVSGGRWVQALLATPPRINPATAPPNFSCRSDDSAFDFDQWVLNTEAHPLRVSQPQGTTGTATEQQQQQHKRWWWPPGRSKVEAGSGDDSGAVTQQRRS